MPDLAKINEENKKKKPSVEPFAEFSYDNTVEETNGALKSFQKKFSKKRGIISLIAYSLLGAAVIVGIVLNPGNVLAYFALAFCLFGLFFTITDRQRTRKRILKTLEGMDPEDYYCTIYPDKIEIETIIRPKNIEFDDDDEELVIKPLKSVFIFGLDMLDLDENDQSLLLYYNRRLVYCFPKRCLGDDADKIREFLTDKIYNS